MYKLPNLTTQTMGHTLIHLPMVDSTNKYLKENAHTLPNMAVVLADSQTQGKGRGDRNWNSEPGAGLYMSILLKDTLPQNLSRMPLLVAMGVRAGLESLCAKPFQIKWSNDVLYEEKKLCGVLCESQIKDDSNIIVIGIGVNLTQSRETLDHLGLVYASSLFLATNKYFSPKETAGAICNALESIILQTSEASIPALWKEYRRHCITLGKRVKVTIGGREAEGLALDITDDGSLLCEIDGKVVPIMAGEATIRGMAGYA